MGKQWKQRQTFFGGGSKITADGDCSHEIKRCLLLGRKVTTNLDSMLKSSHYFADKGPSSQNYGFSSSHVGEGNGNQLQHSCLENPRDGGARWAAVYGVAQSRTRLKWLSSSSSMYGCEHWTIKKAESWRIDAFELWCWRRLLRVPWTARRYNQSILMEISPEYSLERLMLKLKLQYFGYLMQRTDSFEKTLMLGRIEGGRRRG